MDQSDLNPCIKCGPDATPPNLLYCGDHVWAWCDVCQARGPRSRLSFWSMAGEEAINDWNLANKKGPPIKEGQ